jgi:hypothetical protein
MKSINGVDWFFRLVPSLGAESLYGTYGEDHTKITVCWEYNSHRLFGYVSDSDALHHLIASTDEEHRCYYEVADGLSRQRPHFDIDLPASANIDDLDLIGRLEDILREKLPGGEILTYSSHDRRKKSYHIIVYGYWHANHLEAQAFYHQVLDEMPSSYREFIDHSVYSRRQQFRLPGCHKEGTKRIKARYVNGERIPINRSLFHRSLLSVIDEEEQHVEIEVNPLPVSAPIVDVRTEWIEKAFQKLALERHDITAYRVLKIQGSLVLLKRMHSSYCPVCDKVHEKENPYMVITPSFISWYCRRNDEGKCHRIFNDEVWDGEDEEISQPELLLPDPP